MALSSAFMRVVFVMGMMALVAAAIVARPTLEAGWRGYRGAR